MTLSDWFLLGFIGLALVGPFFIPPLDLKRFITQENAMDFKKPDPLDNAAQAVWREVFVLIVNRGDGDAASLSHAERVADAAEAYFRKKYAATPAAE